MNEIPCFRLGGQEREFLLVEVMARERPDYYDFSDGNWLNTKVSVQAGAFGGVYYAPLRSEEFAHFLSSLRMVYKSLGTEPATYVAEFATIEEQLSIVIRGDALGHFEAECIAMDIAGTGSRLEFQLAFDQTDVPAIMSGLETIIKAFPVRGNPSA